MGLVLPVIRAHPLAQGSFLSTQYSKNYLYFPPKGDEPVRTAGLIEQRLQKHLPYARLAGAALGGAADPHTGG